MSVKPKILLVEDDLTVTETMKDLFRYMGLFDCLQIASNGSVALEMVRREKFDLVILDLMLPVMTGLEFLAAANDDPALAGLPVLVNSTREPRSVRQEIAVFRNLKIDMLARPFDPMDLVGRIQALGRGHGSGNERR